MEYFVVLTFFNRVLFCNTVISLLYLSAKNNCWEKETSSDGRSKKKEWPQKPPPMGQEDKLLFGQLMKATNCEQTQKPSWM